jgi:two-component system, NtrC family, C4-dicarboxylate transport response regulator DctD
MRLHGPAAQIAEGPHYMSQWQCKQVALIDDDADLRTALAQMLTLEGLDVMAFSSGEAALAAIDFGFRGIVLSDVRMPGIDGLELQRRLNELDGDLPVILLTGHGDVDMAVRALKSGAYNFLTKPFLTDQILSITKRALDERSLHLELRTVRQAQSNASALIGDTPVMRQLVRTLEQVASLDVDVLIEGETGTGKGLVAKMLHANSPRRSSPLVHVDCGALYEPTIDRDLFGAAPGHVTHTSQRWIGQFESANRGTLFFDSLDCLLRPLQQRLERAVETRMITPLGRTQPEAVDVRIIAASNTPLLSRVNDDNFSAPLYYRLSGMTLRIPPLRERRDDIPVLFGTFLKRACERAGVEAPKLTPSVWRRLKQHDWPGNVRELQNYADQIALSLNGVVDVMITSNEGSEPTKDLKAMVADYETGVIEEALRSAGGNVARVVSQLGLPRKTFYDKVQRLGIDLALFKKR